MSIPSQQIATWHAVPAELAIRELGARTGGLRSSEAAERLALHGPNRLPRAAPPSALRVLLRQFRSPLIYVLAAAGVLSLAIGHVTDAAFIAGVLLLNALIGTIQEWRAERSSHALQDLIRTRATVVRDSEVCEIDAEAIVPGDEVWLESGNRVPADLRLIDSQALEIDESALTGESLAAPKDATWLGDGPETAADQQNMAFAGTVVVRGRGRGLAAATGTSSLVGRLALSAGGAVAGVPPLVLRMERFTRFIALAVLGAALLIGVIGIFGRGYPPAEMFLFVVALAVSAIPEGLPVAMTVALAVSSRRMARRGVIVRKLAAVEGLGSCTLIATDKTGTLTCNELTVGAVVLPDGTQLTVTGEGYAPQGEVRNGDVAVSRDGSPMLGELARAAVLCNEGQLHQRDAGWHWRGDPTDVALLAFGHKAGEVREVALASQPMVGSIPFEPEHRFSASWHECSGTLRVFVKGAPERVLQMCHEAETKADVACRLEVAAEMAAQGYRVLAFAAGNATREQVSRPPEGLTFLGFVGMIDPLRAGVREAVSDCRSAGVTVIMVTGDHPITALAIARSLDLARDSAEVVTGSDLAACSPEALPQLLQRTRVFARVMPEQKLEIVRAAQAAGHFVAVTGDGVNDAPALRVGNIGMAMGRSGTDVARDAAALVVSDDDFSTIVAGIEEGRVAYDNVRKVIYLLVSTGAAEVLLVGLCLATGMPLPLLPVQLLWLNLVTNGIQDVALAFEPGESDVLRRPPRAPSERVFDRIMIERTVVGAITIGLVGFFAFRFMLQAGWSEPSSRNVLLLLMVLFEIVHIGNCRSETRSLFVLSPLRSPILLVGSILALGIHVATMYFLPARAVLGTAPIDPKMWLSLLGLALTVSVTMELHKWIWRRRAGASRSQRAGPVTSP